MGEKQFMENRQKEIKSVLTMIKLPLVIRVETNRTPCFRQGRYRCNRWRLDRGGHSPEHEIGGYNVCSQPGNIIRRYAGIGMVIWTDWCD